MVGKDIKGDIEAREASTSDECTSLDTAIQIAVISFEVSINDYTKLHTDARNNSNILKEF